MNVWLSLPTSSKLKIARIAPRSLSWLNGALTLLPIPLSHLIQKPDLNEVMSAIRYTHHAKRIGLHGEDRGIKRDFAEPRVAASPDTAKKFVRPSTSRS
jgi:hypothetical protein